MLEINREYIGKDTMSYKPFVGSKKIYLTRKKYINRQIKILKKKYKKSGGWPKFIYGKKIENLRNALDNLNTMYKYYKYKAKKCHKRKV